MRPLVRNAVVVAAIVVVGVGGFAGGWIGKEYSTSAASSAQTLWVIGAGSLAPILPSFVSSFTSETPGVTDSVSAQLYQGSTSDAASLAGGSQPYDIFVAADFRVIPQDIETPAPKVASWEVVFASDPMVLAYSTASSAPSALNGISSTNWWTKIVSAGVTLGAPNASSDPLGANAIFVLELEDAAADLHGSLYSHFFNGAQGALASPTSATTYVAENDAATDLGNGDVDVYFVYHSYAVAEHLSYVDLSSGVNLGGTSEANVSAYGAVSTTVVTGPSTTTVETGAPVLFALTVPTTATSPVLGIAFASYLLSNASASAWTSFGFTPVAPEWSDHPSALPAALSGSPPNGVGQLPSYLASLI